MSIILEALRKAEASRGPRRPVVLTTAAAPRLSVQARVPRWAIAGAAVATVSSVVLAVLLLRSGEQAPGAQPAPPRDPPQASAAAAQAPPPAAPPAEAAPPAAAEPSPEPSAEAGEIRGLSLEARLASPPAAAGPARRVPGSVEVRDLVGGTDEGAEPPAAPRRAPGRVEVRDLLAEEGLAEPVEISPPAANADSEESERQALENKERGLLARAPEPPPKPATPSLDELVADGQLNPPDISLDMHAWSEDPEARFVYINMRRYRVGETTREGAIVDDITPDGVILQLQGRRFLLSAH